MDDINVKIELKGKSGKTHVFVHHYNLAKNEEPKSSGIYVFAKQKDNNQPVILDIQFLSAEGDLPATVARVKEDGATDAFFGEGGDELQCDADIDDIKDGSDYRNRVE